MLKMLLLKCSSPSRYLSTLCEKSPCPELGLVQSKDDFNALPQNVKVTMPLLSWENVLFMQDWLNMNTSPVLMMLPLIGVWLIMSLRSTITSTSLLTYISDDSIIPAQTVSTPYLFILFLKYIFLFFNSSSSVKSKWNNKAWLKQYIRYHLNLNRNIHRLMMHALVL